MIESVTVTNYLGDETVVRLAGPEKPRDFPAIITNIEGLGPVSATINTTKVATADGSVYNSALLDERNITMSLLFIDDGTKTIEEIRRESYKYFPIKRGIHLSIKTDGRTLEIDGYVESNEPVIFSNQESTSISIICPDPFFYSPRNDITEFSVTHPAFEFPFGTEEPAYVDDKELELFELDTMEDSTEATIVYEGDSEVGLTMAISFLGYAESVSIYNKMTNEIMIIDASRLTKLRSKSSVIDVPADERKFKSGDVININTKKRNKSMSLIRSGVEYNILNCFGKEATWFTLAKGENTFYFTAALDGDPDKATGNVRLTTKNKIIYDGV